MGETFYSLNWAILTDQPCTVCSTKSDTHRSHRCLWVTSWLSYDMVSLTLHPFNCGVSKLTMQSTHIIIPNVEFLEVSKGGKATPSVHSTPRWEPWMSNLTFIHFLSFILVIIWLPASLQNLEVTRGKEGTRQLYVLQTGLFSDRPARTLGQSTAVLVFFYQLTFQGMEANSN